MTTAQITLVKKSWKTLSKINAELIGDVFYSKLFLESPELKAFFQTSREEQSRKLIYMLNVIITSLDRLEELKADITALAQRHKKYGALPEHYDKVGAALLWTIKKTMAEDFTPETEQAWLACYSILKVSMLSAY